MERDSISAVARKIIEQFRVVRPYILSHHPLCDQFIEDCYKLGKHRLCIGCFTSYPITLIVVMVWYLGLIELDYPTLYIIGTLAGSVQFLRLLPQSNRKGFKMVIKVFLGVGIGLYIAAIFSLPLLIFHKIIILIICVQLSGYFGILRMEKMKASCHKCEHQADWNSCPGFEILHRDR